MSIPQDSLLTRLGRADVVCKDCGTKYGKYSVGCSSTWNGTCGVCGEDKPVTEVRDWGYLTKGINAEKAKIAGQSLEVANYIACQEEIASQETDNHPINPSPELMREWVGSQHGYLNAARWGADKELEACCEWLTSQGLIHFPMQGMLEARRPKPLSLKELALAELNLTTDSDGAELSRTQVELIRRALEELPD